VVPYLEDVGMKRPRAPGGEREQVRFLGAFRVTDEEERPPPERDANHERVVVRASVR